MKIKRTLKWMVLTCLGLFAVFNIFVLSVALWAFTHPQQAWRIVEQRFLPRDLRITWSQLAFTPQRHSLFNWDIDLQISGLQIEKISPLVSVLADDIDVRFSFQAFAPGLHIQLHDLKVDATRPLVFKPTPSAKPGQRSFYQQMHRYFAYLSTAHRVAQVEHLDISIAEFQLVNPQGKALPIGFELHKPEKDNERVDFSVVVKNLAPPTADELTVKGRIDMAQFKLAEPVLHADVLVRGRDLQVKTEVDLTAQDEEARAIVLSQITYKLKKRTISSQPRVQLSLNAKRFAARLESTIEGLPGPVEKIGDLKANVKIPMEDGAEWSSAPSTFFLSTPVALFFIDKNMRRPIEKSCECRIPEKLLVQLEGAAWAKTFFESAQSRRPLLNAKLSIEGVRNKLFSVDLAARLRVDQQGQQWIYEPSTDSDIQVHSFQGLRRYVDAKNIMIPAPFDVLDGIVDISAKGPVLITKDAAGKTAGFETPVTLTAALSSKLQKVAFTMTANFKVDSLFRKIEAAVRLRIDDLQVELPPLDPILGLPRLSRDSRMHMTPPQPATKKTKFKVSVTVDAETAKPGAIRLLSPLAAPFVPISLNVHQSAQANSGGFIRLEPFQITYLRRTVHVESFQLALDETKKGDFPITGRLRIDQTDYKIFIDIGGTADAPQFELSSEPYLDRNNIISVMLYDRTSDQLVSSDSETSGSFQAAMADRAIGLFGLWAFATTPIRSFSYNPVTKVYTATVQLADGLTAGVGTDWENAAHLEVRKRVSKRWVLTASWNPSEDQGDVGKVVLQWEKRF